MWEQPQSLPRPQPTVTNRRCSTSEERTGQEVGSQGGTGTARVKHRPQQSVFIWIKPCQLASVLWCTPTYSAVLWGGIRNRRQSLLGAVRNIWMLQNKCGTNEETQKNEHQLKERAPPVHVLHVDNDCGHNEEEKKPPTDSPCECLRFHECLNDLFGSFRVSCLWDVWVQNKSTCVNGLRL